MIAKLTGILDSSGEDWAIIDVRGVGYLVQCSSRTLSRLAPGEAVSLQIETIVREDALSLYGFLSSGERSLFRLLTTVQGVGARVALAILSVASPEQIQQGLMAQDKALFSRASGVGPKLAGRLVSELKEKATTLILTPSAAVPQPEPLTDEEEKAPSAVKSRSKAAKAAADAEAARLAARAEAQEDAVSALVNLGYGRAEAFPIVARVAQGIDGALTSSQLISAALKELGKSLSLS